MKNIKLTTSRDLLLFRLISGKLSVEKIDIKFFRAWKKLMRKKTLTFSGKYGIIVLTGEKRYE